MSDPIHAEQERLAAVHALQWLETAESEDFDRICRLAAAYFKVPTVLVSLVEKDRQWFAGRVGFDAPETPIDQSFCAHTIRQDDVMVVPNACQDPRFVANTLVTREGGIRFYAGAQLKTRQGLVLGSLCIINRLPDQLEETERLALKDFAEMVMAQIEQRQMLNHRDPITGLPNLRQFLADHAYRNPAEDGRLLVMIDALDRHWGQGMTLTQGIRPLHAVIKRLAERLSRRLEDTTPLYHISERQFCFMLPAQIPHREAMVHSVVLMLCESELLEGVTTQPAARAGVAQFDSPDESITDLLRKAMYAVETATQGRTYWATYDAVKDSAYRRAFTFINDLPRALTNGEIYLEFQPRFSLGDGRQVSAEALLRWKHPVLGQISPAEFIPVIERDAQISRVTRWVLDNALLAMTSWRNLDCKLSINLSPLDFHSMGIADAIQLACLEHQVDAKRLEFEITEGEWIRSNPNVLEQLAKIRGLGADVAIDDFGTGYSNFAYLHEIPANVIKLDQSIVTNLEHSKRNRVIARSIFQLAHDLGYRTVAEGIETFKCMELVREFGCHEAQGYFFSRPISAERFAALCDANRFPLQALSCVVPVSEPLHGRGLLNAPQPAPLFV